MPTITKTQNKIKVTSKQRSYQIRLTVTPQIHQDILKARKKYKYLDDIEIIKIFIGKGADLENDDDLAYLSNEKWNLSGNSDSFENADEAVDFLNSTKKDWRV